MSTPEQAARRPGHRVPLRRLQRVLRPLPRPADGLHVRLLPGPRRQLEQAQADKLELVCRKLRLQPGETLLDIGCGWGSLAIWAAQHYGVRAHGVTLSRAQADFAAERIGGLGLADRCRVEYLDFRDLPGRRRATTRSPPSASSSTWASRTTRRSSAASTRCSTPGGYYLNHGITHEFHWKPTSHTTFLTRYVFPNGDLAGLTETITEMERARFEILDVEGLRRHYARTCRQWAERLRGARRRGAPHRRRADLPHLAALPHLLRRRLRDQLDRSLSGPHAEARGSSHRRRSRHPRVPVRRLDEAQHLTRSARRRGAPVEGAARPTGPHEPMRPLSEQAGRRANGRARHRRRSRAVAGSRARRGRAPPPPGARGARGR